MKKQYNRNFGKQNAKCACNIRNDVKYGINSIYQYFAVIKFKEDKFDAPSQDTAILCRSRFDGSLNESIK